MLKPRWVLYPFLIAPYPAIAFYAQNAEGLPLRELAWPVALMMAASVLVGAMLRLVVKEPARAGLLTVLAFAVFYTVELVPEWVDGGLQYASSFWVLQEFHVWRPLVIGMELAAASGLAWTILTKLREPKEWTIYLNAFALLLIILPSTNIFLTVMREPVKAEGPPGAMIEPPSTVARPPGTVDTAQGTGHHPDIYYIILDGYARTDVMLDLFGFDNRPFLKRLESRGFYIAGRSTANYCQTPLSLSSSLNGVYLNGLIPASSHDKSQLAEWIGNGAVVRTLRGLGYRFVTFATGFDETEHPEADAYLAPSTYISLFHQLLISRTPLKWFLPGPSMRDGYILTRERILFLIDKIPQVAKCKRPTFTFAHILAPHPPFVFGENGEDVSPHDRYYYLTDGELFGDHYGNRDTYAAGYRKQAVFLTKQVEQMIDRILANSPEPPVIILQSDHGSGLRLSTHSLEQTDLHERMSILNAYYLPGPGGQALYRSISPVNSFRVVFNAYFGAGLDLLPDRSYFSTWNEPFEFSDVTDRVRPVSDIGRVISDQEVE
jgi:hypothetical protein